MNVSKKQMIEVTETLKQVTEQRDALYQAVKASLEFQNLIRGAEFPKPIIKEARQKARQLSEAAIKLVDEQLKR